MNSFLLHEMGRYIKKRLHLFYLVPKCRRRINEYKFEGNCFQLNTRKHLITIESIGR